MTPLLLSLIIGRFSANRLPGLGLALVGAAAVAFDSLAAGLAGADLAGIAAAAALVFAGYNLGLIAAVVSALRRERQQV